MIETPSPDRELHEHSAVYGSDPNHRLSLIFISVLDGAGRDFYELVWQRLFGTEWRNHLAISAAQFQVGSNLTRWISKLHSFNPAEAQAIVQVGEVDSPDPQHHRAIYTWRSLHLPTLELRTLQLCSDPIDPYASG